MLQMLNLDVRSMSVFPSAAVIWTNAEATLWKSSTYSFSRICLVFLFSYFNCENISKIHFTSTFLQRTSAQS